MFYNLYTDYQIKSPLVRDTSFKVCLNLLLPGEFGDNLIGRARINEANALNP
jgi:hypothetical protein